MDQSHLIFVAGILAFTIAAGTYVIWGPSQKSKRKSKVPGLQNLGNSCFVNAVVQALAACPLFINWLKNKVNGRKSQSSDPISALCTILLELNSNAGLCSAAPLVNALRSRRWVISNEEEDAHEFFHVMTTTLEEDLAEARPVLSLLEISKLEDNSDLTQFDMPTKIFIRSSNTAGTKHSLPFRGLLANQFVCQQCSHKYPVKYDTFDSISLSIPTPVWGQLTLQDCIQKFVSCEQISDVTCDMCCEKQKSIVSSKNQNTSMLKSTFIKQISFGKLPECLCFHIQRTVWLNNGVSRKCFDYLMFPEVLSMDSFIYKCPTKNQTDGSNVQKAKLIGGNSLKHESLQPTNSVSEPVLNTNWSQAQPSTAKSPLTLLAENHLPSGDHMYLLKAVIVHLGDLLAGHFVTYRRGPINTSHERKWFCTSDASTREVPFADVKQVCAYMLFYERIPSM